MTTTPAPRQPTAALPTEVSTLANRYLDAVDQALPGFVEMLYIAGSTALGAWQPGYSDVDALVVTSRKAEPDDLVALAEIHAGMPAKPDFDGIYLDGATFTTQPADDPPVLFVRDGTLHPDKPSGNLNPVLWLILQRCGLSVRGPVVANLGLTVDPVALRRYNLDNLRTYWKPLAELIRQRTRDLPDRTPIGGENVAHAMLGPARLHYTLAVGDVIPKSGSAAYLAEHFRTWADLAERTTRWRAGEPVTFTIADLRTAAASIDTVADDAWDRFGSSPAGGD